MKLKTSKGKGSLAWKVCWISLSSQYSELKFSTEKELFQQIKHLRGLRYRLRDIAVYRHYEVVE